MFSKVLLLSVQDTYLKSNFCSLVDRFVALPLEIVTPLCLWKCTCHCQIVNTFFSSLVWITSWRLGKVLSPCPSHRLSLGLFHNSRDFPTWGEDKQDRHYSGISLDPLEEFRSGQSHRLRSWVFSCILDATCNLTRWLYIPHPSPQCHVHLNNHLYPKFWSLNIT